MADVVIVVGAKRGPETVPVAEIRQMVGRAGRKHGGDACKAYVLVDGEDFVDVQEGMEGDAKFEVSSAMVSCDDVVFHLLPGICLGDVADDADAAMWYARSFGSAQGRKPDLGRVFKKLEEWEAVECTPLGWVPTKMAYVASDMYFHPADVKAWRDNFRVLFEAGLERDDAAVAWALGSVPMMDASGDFGNHRFVMSLYKEALPAELSAEPGMVAKGTLWWSALGGPSVGRMRNRMLEFRGDFGRLSRVLLRLNEIEEWGMEKFFVELEKRMRKGIPDGLCELFRIRGMTKGMAQFLYNAGVRNRQDIRESVDSFEDDVDELGMCFLREVASGIR